MNLKSNKKPNPTNFSNLRSQDYLDYKLHKENSKIDITKPLIPNKKSLSNKKLKYLQIDNENKENISNQINFPSTSKQTVHNSFKSINKCFKESKKAYKINQKIILDTDLDEFKEQNSEFRKEEIKKSNNMQLIVFMEIIIVKF